MRLKRILSVVVSVFVMSAFLTACSDNTATTQSASENVNAAGSASSSGNGSALQNSDIPSYVVSDADIVKTDVDQLAEPSEGDTVATITVKNFGDIKVRFFPDSAPKAVENFITHAKNGYYDGLKFHRVIEDFMLQSGDPNGDGTGGESIWKDDFNTEIDINLHSYKGALCMARTNITKSCGSQFYIVQAGPETITDSVLSEYGFSNEVINNYKTIGGYPYLDGQYTIFGQVYDGLDVVDKIAAVEKNISDMGEESVPVEDVVIEKIVVETL